MTEPKNEQHEIDEVSGVETVGHEWDGIKELNTPVPNWWRWIFYACIVWSFGYWIAYPAIPLIDSYTTGMLGYSSRAEVAAEMAAAKDRQATHIENLRNASLEEIRTDSNLLEFALAGGRSAFIVNCSQCHGSGAQGFAGYPNLNDDEWLWGGSLEQIQYTITHGARNDVDDDAHFSDMPAFLDDEILDAQEIADVTQYVLKISGQDHQSDSAVAGSATFADQCAACHSDDGSGDIDAGAPSLDNAI